MSFVVVVVVAVYVTFLSRHNDVVDSDLRPSMPSFGTTLGFRRQNYLHGFIETQVGLKNRI